MARLEIIGELKYSGLESGTTNWKQGTMVLHSKDGCWKLDLHINCNRRGPVQSFQVRPIYSEAQMLVVTGNNLQC